MNGGTAWPTNPAWITIAYLWLANWIDLALPKPSKVGFVVTRYRPAGPSCVGYLEKISQAATQALTLRTAVYPRGQIASVHAAAERAARR
jgi:hypothetical protein